VSLGRVEALRTKTKTRRSVREKDERGRWFRLTLQPESHRLLHRSVIEQDVHDREDVKMPGGEQSLDLKKRREAKVRTRRWTSTSTLLRI